MKIKVTSEHGLANTYTATKYNEGWAFVNDSAMTHLSLGGGTGGTTMPTPAELFDAAKAIHPNLEVVGNLFPKLNRGDTIRANGYEGAYVCEYSPASKDSYGMHEVRLPGGVACVCGSTIEIISPRNKRELMDKINRNGGFLSEGDLELLIKYAPGTNILARCNSSCFIAAAADMPRMLEIIELADAKMTESLPIGEWVRDLSLPTPLTTV